MTSSTRSLADRDWPGRRARAAWARQAAKRDPGVTAATRSASRTVSMSVSSGSIVTRRPACWSRASCFGPVSGCDIGTPRMRSGIDLAQAEQPEAAVLGHAEGGVGGPGSPAARPPRPAGPGSPAGCPSRSAPPAAAASPARRTSAQAIRSSRPAPRCPITSNPWGSQRPGVPSRASTRRATVVAATAARVSDRDAAASSAASTGVNGGVSLVFTRPGTGSLAITTICAASRRPALLQAGLAWAGTCPACRGHPGAEGAFAAVLAGVDVGGHDAACAVSAGAGAGLGRCLAGAGAWLRRVGGRGRGDGGEDPAHVLDGPGGAADACR